MPWTLNHHHRRHAAPSLPPCRYRCVTSTFLHGGIVHLGLNMYNLHRVGRIAEAVVGRRMAAFAYAASALCGSAAQLAMEVRMSRQQVAVRC